MHGLLEKLLRKRNITDVEHLDADEKADFDRWNRILSSEEVTVQTIAAFCESQLSAIELGFRDLAATPEITARRSLLHGVYKSILQLIKAPKLERETLEQYLQSLLQ